MEVIDCGKGMARHWYGNPDLGSLSSLPFQVFELMNFCAVPIIEQYRDTILTEQDFHAPRYKQDEEKIGWVIK